MKKSDFRKTLFLLKRYNFSIEFSENFLKDIEETKSIIIKNCYLFELNKVHFNEKLNEEDTKRIKEYNKISYLTFQKIKDRNYFEIKNFIFKLSKCAFINNTNHDYTLIEKLLLSDDINGKIWNTFMDSKSKQITIISKILPEVNDYIDIKLTTMQKVILSLYENECSMKEIICCFNNHPEISIKYSKKAINKFVLANTLFFLYWGIIINNSHE